MLSFRAKQRPFMIADYQNGILIEIPAECPWSDSKSPCDIVLHGLRKRRTGPPHPLAVCRCHAHDVAFTIYPAGFVPFARQPLNDQISGSSTPQVPGPTVTARGPNRSLLDALYAADRVMRERVSLSLHLPLHLLFDLATMTTLRDRTLAFASILAGIGDRLDALLLTGTLAGCWGVPFRWNRSPQRLEPLAPDSHRNPLKASTSLKHGLHHGINTSHANATHMGTHDKIHDSTHQARPESFGEPLSPRPPTTAKIEIIGKNRYRSEHDAGPPRPFAQVR